MAPQSDRRRNGRCRPAAVSSGSFCTGPGMRVMRGTEECRTLAIDIGGTGIKLALLDGAGKMIGERARVPTPTPPAGPELVAGTIDQVAASLGAFDRASVGFPGMVRHGRVLTAPHLGTDAWAG